MQSIILIIVREMLKMCWYRHY